MAKFSTPLRLALMLGIAGLPGCVAAAAAGAGAATGVYLTSRGASSLVNGTPEQIAANVQSVMASENITPTGKSTDNGGDHREFKGTKGDLDINITIDRKSPTTANVEVTSKKNAVEWDKDYSKMLLSKIVAKS
jgi:hypothetical protein